MSRPLRSLMLATAALASLAGTADAATAYNSQRGSLEHNKNVCEATVYFPAGGCLSSIFAGNSDDLFDQPPARYRPGHPLTYPTGPLPIPGR